MTEHSSYSERLHAFLDGELDASDTGDLFYVLARNQDLQAEMRQLIALRNAFPAPLLQPPAALKENILRATVLRAEPAPEATPVRWTFGRLFGDHGLPMLLAALAASLLTAALFYLLVAPATGPVAAHTSAVRPTLPDSAGQAPGMRSAGRTSGPAGAPIAGASPAPLPATNLSERVASERSASVRREVRIGPAAGSLANTRLNGGAVSVRNVATSALMAPEAMPPLIEPVELKSADTSTARGITSEGLRTPHPVSSMKVPTSPNDTAPPEESPRPWMLEARMSFTGLTFMTPAFDLPPLNSSVLNNASVSLLYAIDSNSRTGVAAGQQSFLQEYDGIENGLQVRYRQNYVAPWGGLFYEHALLKTNVRGVGIEMFGRALLGGCASGPLGKLVIATRVGSPWPGGFAVIVGTEATTLRYQYQQRWFHTENMGITGGVAVQF